MVKAKLKGYVAERKVRKIFEKFGWYVVKAGGSLGVADLVCLKEGKCLLIQVKSTRNKVLYYKDYDKEKFSGFEFWVVVDFAYRGLRIVKPKEKITLEDGKDLEEFLKSFSKG